MLTTKLTLEIHYSGHTRRKTGFNPLKMIRKQIRTVAIAANADKISGAANRNHQLNSASDILIERRGSPIAKFEQLINLTLVL